MAHFAEIDPNGIVIRVIVVSNSDTIDSNGNEIEQIGKDFCTRLLGGNWVQTSYNGNLRKNFAGIGYMYDSSRDAFIPKKPYPSWILDENTCRWNPPIQYPSDEGKCYWDESTLSWEKII